MFAKPRVHPYEGFLHRVTKPARYLGGEHGEIVKSWDSVDCRICLAFPDLYDIGMSHLGFKILYSIINKHPKLLAERMYAPWTDMEAQLREQSEPLRSLESWRPLGDFDIVGFSLQFELTYTNILLILELGGVPLRSHDRNEDDPLVIAGGPTATHAEPIAPFIDAFVIGDGEEKTPELMLTWSALRRSGMPRQKRLECLARLGGIYVSALYPTKVQTDTGLRVVEPASGDVPYPVKRAFVSDISKHPFPSDGPVAATETIFDRVSVEIARGCTEGCRFCQAGMIYRPVRERTPNDITEALMKSIKEGGYDEASLTSLSTADYSAIAPLIHEVMNRLEPERVSLSVSSLRAYGLGEELLDDIQRVRATGLTFAPEAGTQRMRDVINKNITEEQLMQTAERVFSRGWSKMKLYFMIGLPTEEDEDVRGIVQTGARAQAIGKKMQRGMPRVTVSVSTFVPKPHTPFQWCAMDNHDAVLRKQALLKEEARGTRVQLRMHDSQGSWLESILSRGDRTLADAIETAYHQGARFDSWEEQLKLKVWEEALRKHGIDPVIYQQTIPVDARLPWDHLDVGLEEGFLLREYRKALRNRLSPPCGKALHMHVHHTNLEDALDDQRKLICYHCGVACDLTEMRAQRVEYLQTLGANKRRKVLEPLPESGPVATRNRQLPVQVPQGPALTVRLAYTKLGRAAYSSHLDLVRLIPRICRRLDLPLRYSQGFHPKPEMSFGPALSLGVASLAEYVDIKLKAQDIIDRDEVLRRLTTSEEEGITITAAQYLGNEDSGLSKAINLAIYVAGIPEAALKSSVLKNIDGLHAHIEAQRGLPLVVRRDVKGIGKRIEVGRYLQEVHVAQGAEVLEKAGYAGDLVPIRFRVSLEPTGSAKASEVMTALLGEIELPLRLVREALVYQTTDAMLTPLQLGELRALVAGSASALAQAV